MGGFSSRNIAQACERNLAFIAIVGAARPDFRPISDFRTLPLDAFCAVFVEGRRIAGEAGLVKLGKVSTEGTKLQGNASRHKAMSDGYRTKEVERLREEIEALVTQAYRQEAQDDAALGSRRGDARPAALARRADRLATIEAAMQRLEARAQADADAERTRRAEAEAERQRTGTTRRGKAPQEVTETPEDKAQMSVTDPALRIMPTNKKGWDYCGNAQVRVDGASQILVACDVTAAANDKQHAVPRAQLTVAQLAQAGIKPPKDATGAVQKIPATYDSGYDSETAAAAVEQGGFDPSMAPGRPRHQGPEAAAETPTTAKERMAVNIQSPAGPARYARRKVSVEPVFGQLKEARGFRRFLLRGWATIRGEGCLVCLTHNLRKVWRYAYAPCTVSAVEMGTPWTQKGLFPDDIP